MLAPAPAIAQRLGTILEVFGSASLVGGVTSVAAPSGSHAALHGGARGDAGIQIGHLGLGLGGRIWQMVPTQEYGGTGFDYFLVGEWREEPSSRTTIRGAFGGGWDDFDSGRGPERPNSGAQGIMWSVGIGHQVIAPRDTRLLLTADLIVPPPPSGGLGRKRPVLEVGVGKRYVGFHPIGPTR